MATEPGKTGLVSFPEQCRLCAVHEAAVLQKLAVLETDVSWVKTTMQEIRADLKDHLRYHRTARGMAGGAKPSRGMLAVGVGVASIIAGVVAGVMKWLKPG